MSSRLLPSDFAISELVKQSSNQCHHHKTKPQTRQLHMVCLVYCIIFCIYLFCSFLSFMVFRVSKQGKFQVLFFKNVAVVVIFVVVTSAPAHQQQPTTTRSCKLSFECLYLCVCACAYVCSCIVLQADTYSFLKLQLLVCFLLAVAALNHKHYDNKKETHIRTASVWPDL